jgi:hypothetical protein
LAECQDVRPDAAGKTFGFVLLDNATCETIVGWLAPDTWNFHLYRVSAEKASSDTSSIAPTLGIDATLPYHRLSTPPKPLQNEYPVPYFLYGTLTELQKLMEKLELDEKPVFKPTLVRRRKIRMCGEGKYRALVDS